VGGVFHSFCLLSTNHSSTAGGLPVEGGHRRITVNCLPGYLLRRAIYNIRFLGDKSKINLLAYAYMPPPVSFPSASGRNPPSLKPRKGRYVNRNGERDTDGAPDGATCALALRADVNIRADRIKHRERCYRSVSESDGFIRLRTFSATIHGRALFHLYLVSAPSF